MNPYDTITYRTGVYYYLNLNNGRIYVGQSESIDHRIDTHLGQLRSGKHPNAAWQRDWTYYGEAAFEWGVLATIPQRLPRPGFASLIDLETIFIHAYQAKDPRYGYNAPSLPRKKPKPIDLLNQAANDAARLYRPDAIHALISRLTHLELAA